MEDILLDWLTYLLILYRTPVQLIMNAWVTHLTVTVLICVFTNASHFPSTFLSTSVRRLEFSGFLFEIVFI